MTASGLVGLVQPMLWDYTPDLDVEKTGRNCISWKLVFKHCALLHYQTVCNMHRALLVVMHVLT